MVDTVTVTDGDRDEAWDLIEEHPLGGLSQYKREALSLEIAQRLAEARQDGWQRGVQAGREQVADDLRETLAGFWRAQRLED